MVRTSPCYYISPSAISISPNANGSASDLAVNVVKGAKIKVYSQGIQALGWSDSVFQQWTLTGRNRRLADSAKPYTIYARLNKSNKEDGYLVFAPKEADKDGNWLDKYAYVTMQGLATGTANKNVSDYWYVKLGEVSLPTDNARTVSLDTGILGTDQFNTEWNLHPDDMPLRVELSATIDLKDAGSKPYVPWGKKLVLRAKLLQGWADTTIPRFHHFTIQRNTGDTDADKTYNYPDAKSNSEVESSGRQMSDGNIILSHARGEGDVFNGTVSSAWTVIAWGTKATADGSTSSSSSGSSASSSESSEDASASSETTSASSETASPSSETTSPSSDSSSSLSNSSTNSDSSSESSDKDVVKTETYERLAEATINILAETAEQFSLERSSAVVNYDPSSDTYNPSEGVDVMIRAVDQKGEVFKLTNAQRKASSLAIQYCVAENPWNTCDFKGADTEVAKTKIPIEAFHSKKNVNVRIVRVIVTTSPAPDPSSTPSSDPASQTTTTTYKELYRTHIPIIRNGEDSKEREWIFLRSASAILFSFDIQDTTKPLIPSLINGGEVKPEEAATGDDTNKNQDGWVPEGWWDEMRGTDSEYHYEYAAYRDYIKGGVPDSSSSASASSESASDPSKSGNAAQRGGHWGDFSTPRIWGYYANDAVSYRCRWTLAGVEVYQLKCAYTGAFRGTLPLVGTLLKRVGNGQEQEVTGKTVITLKCEGIDYSKMFTTDNPTFTVNTTDKDTADFVQYLNKVELSGLSVSFTVNGEEHNFSIPVIREADEDSVINTIDKYADDHFLRKDKNDETKFHLGMDSADVDTVLQVGGTAQSKNYTHTGFPFGTGWAAMKDDGHGASMLEVDKLFVRMKAYFAELEIRKISYLGGNYVFSSAGGTIYYVEWLDANKKVLEKTEDNEDLVKYFRCYLYSDDGTTKTMNWFKTDDQVRCQNFGMAGTTKAANGVITEADHTTHYWWRRVNGVGSGVISAKGDDKKYEYVEFWNYSGQYGAGSDFPEEGDVMVQFGNWTEPERQGVIMIVVTGDDAPAIIEWQDVGANYKHFTMPEKEYTRLSPRGDGNIIRGKFISVSGTTTDNTGKSLDEQINALIEQLNDIKNQADRKFDIWFNGGEPHPNSAEDKATNAPASDWTTDAEKGLHAQDLYYDTDKDPASNGGRAWRWMAHNTDGNVAYYWDKVTDADTIAALDKARDVQNQVNDIANDGIISHGSEKSELYIEWNKLKSNYTKYNDLANKYSLSKAYDSEWSVFSRAALGVCVMLNGNDDSYTLDDLRNGIIPAWVQDLTTDTKLSDYNDLTAEDYRVKWNAYNAALADLIKLLSTKTKDLVDAAQTSADEKVQTFVSASNEPPKPPYKKGDFWIQTNNKNNVLICIAGKSAGESYNPKDWTDLSDLVSSTDVRTILATLADKVYALVWDDYLGKSTIRYVDVYIGSQPSSSVYDYDLSYYNGVLYKRNSSWQEVNGSGFESTFATVMSILGTIKIRVSNYTNTASPKQYDLALTQISIKDPVDGNETMGTCEIEMCNEKGAWEVLRTCTLAILKNYGDHIVSVVKGIQGDVSEISGSYVTQGTFNAFSQKFIYDADGNIINTKKSGLLTTADGNLLYAMSQSNTVNMLMGTTTGVGWTKEVTSDASYFKFNEAARQFDLVNYYPAFRSGFEEKGTSYSTLKSPIVRIEKNKKYVISFCMTTNSKVQFSIGIRFGTASECSNNARYFTWANNVEPDDNSGKQAGVIYQSKSDSSRYFVIIETNTSSYEYMQVLFINAVSRDDVSTPSSTQREDTWYNTAWPYPSTSNQLISSNTTISEYDTKKVTVEVYDAYTGSSTQYVRETATTTESVTPISMSVSKIQMELAVRDTIADIEPSDYKESQNAIESYIKQTADSIRIKANTVVINDKFWVDSNGDVHMNNAHLAGVLSSGSGVKQITIGGNDQNGEINVGGYITLHYDANIEGDKIYGVSVNGSGGVITVKGTPANNVYLNNYQPTQITGYSVYSMGAYFRGLMVSKGGIDVIRGSLRLSSISSGSVAISNDSDGYIKGARFKTETLNTSKSYAYETDVRNIICTNTSAITIQLPSSPVLGDELIIIQEGAKIDFLSPSIKFKYSNNDIGTTANSNSTGQLNYFLFDGTYWHARYIKVGRPW